MKIMISVLGVVAFFAATPSIAGEPYVGASLGVMRVDDKDSASGIEFDDTPFAGKLFGGYEFNENFALELAYFSTIQDAEDDILGLSVDVEIDGFNLRAIGMIPTSDTFSLMGSVGYYDGEADVSVSGLGSASDDESGVTLGAGVQYYFEPSPGPRWSFRGEFEWFDSDIDDLWTLMFGVQVSF